MGTAQEIKINIIGEQIWHFLKENSPEHAEEKDALIGKQKYLLLPPVLSVISPKCLTGRAQIVAIIEDVQSL